jgi:hypothetical protein
MGKLSGIGLSTCPTTSTDFPFLGKVCGIGLNARRAELERGAIIIVEDERRRTRRLPIRQW